MSLNTTPRLVRLLSLVYSMSVETMDHHVTYYRHARDNEADTHEVMIRQFRVVLNVAIKRRRRFYGMLKYQR